jgi:beta-1,4-N-acetylglucosaminyltransferase
MLSVNASLLSVLFNEYPHTCIAFLAVSVLCCLRFVALLSRTRRWQAPAESRTQPVSTLCVLGSGGHTAEMLSLLSAFDRTRYNIVFVAASTDANSLQRVAQLESQQPQPAAASPSPASVVTVPRSRAVAQSWLTTPFTTLYAAFKSFAVVWRYRPEIV